MKIKTVLKALTIVIVTIVLLIVLAVSGIYILFSIPDKTEDFKTDYGDSFRISYDGFQVKTAISDNNSRFYIIVRDKVESGDIVGLANDTDLKAYKVKNIIFYDEGNGFEFFSGDTKNKKVISLAKNHLTSKQFYDIIHQE